MFSVVLIGLFLFIRSNAYLIEFSPTDIQIQVAKNATVEIVLKTKIDKGAHFQYLYVQRDDKPLKATPQSSIISKLENFRWTNDSLRKKSVKIHGKKVGRIFLGFNATKLDLKRRDIKFLKIAVIHNKSLTTFNIVIGWIYFFAWSISFYPQIYTNFVRKSVVGLNFDFVSYNLLGFFSYSLFNIGMSWIPVVKKEYFDSHPLGVNPVLLNDVVFSIHAFAATFITGIQCLIYYRGDQKLSKFAIVLLSLTLLMLIITLFVAVSGKITWLLYLQLFSYVKLGVTLIKYVPQAWMNFKRKSTEGWSIGNVLLDFTGGSLSILQMFLQSYNNNDWTTIFGDLTKFGLGLFSVLFDCLFLVQHYILYRRVEGYINIESERDLLEEE